MHMMIENFYRAQAQFPVSQSFLRYMVVYRCVLVGAVTVDESAAVTCSQFCAAL